MKVASFAQKLEEEIPRTMDQSPCDASISTVEHLDRAGRTPHNKKIEAERNISLLKKSLQLSAKKPFPTYYDSPASVLTADLPKIPQSESRDENVHPNATEKAGNANSRKAQFLNLKSPQKFGSAAGTSFSFLTNDATPHAPTVSWTPFESNTGLRSTPAMPLSSAGYTPAASLPPRARMTPPSAASTITAVSVMESSVAPQSISVELSASSPASTQITSIEVDNIASSSQCGEGSPNQLWAMLNDGTMSTQSSPGVSVPQSSAAPVNNSADLWALLTDDQSSVQSTPGSIAQASYQSAPVVTESRRNTPGSVFQQPLTPYHNLQAASVSASSSPTSVSMQSTTAVLSPMYQQAQTPFAMESVAASTRSAPASAHPVVSPSYLLSHTPYCLEPVAASAKPTPASAAAKSVASHASPAPVSYQPEASVVVSAAKSIVVEDVEEEVAEAIFVANTCSMHLVAPSAKPSPAASVSSARAMPVSLSAPSPCLNSVITAHSPATVVSEKMSSSAAPMLTVQITKAATPAPTPVPTPVAAQASVKASPVAATEVAGAQMYSPIEHFPYSSSPPGIPDQQDADAESIITESSRGSRGGSTPYASAPVRVAVTPEQECNTCNTSMASMSSTSSPAILCRQGGVALGRGPSLYPSQFASVKQNLQGSKKGGSPVANKTNKLNTSTSSNSSGMRSTASRVPVHNIEGSARKPGLPRQDAASKVDRKHLAFIPRPKPYSASATTSTPKAATRSGVSRSTKRSKQDGVQDTSASLNVSCATASTSSTISICGVEATSILTEPQLLADAVSQVVEAGEPVVSMCNVSIQCDSFLISGNTTAINGIAAIGKGMPIPNRSRYDCFEAGLDSEVVSLDGSNTQSAALDYSIDSPDHNTPPKSLKHTPMFMSYRKMHRDSDSEDDLMMEMGLEDLLDHTAVSPQASPIARRHSFEDTCNSAFPFDIGQKDDSTSRASTATKEKSQASASASVTKPVAVTVGWEHSFSAPSVTVSTTPGTVSSRGASSCSRLTRTASSRKSMLGSAKRVSLQGEVQEQVYYYSAEGPEQESVDETSAAPVVSGTFPEWHHSVDYTSQEFRGLYEAAEESQHGAAYLNATVMTDVAVVPADVTVNSVNESHVFDLSQSTEEVTCAETTMTLDHKHHLDDSVSQLVDEECGPRLAIMSLKRDNTSAEDIKEINFTTSPGEATTVMLTISNHREKSMRMHSHAVSLRFEEYASGGGLLVPEKDLDCDGELDDALTVETAAPPTSFTVSPAELKLAPGESGTLYVTFTPQENLNGVYSGALKIRSRTKAFVFLLRGKALKKSRHDASEGIAAKQIGIADTTHELDTSLFKRIKRLNNNACAKSSPAPLLKPATLSVPAPVASPVPAVATPVSIAASIASPVAPQAPSVKVQRALPSLQVNPDTLLLQKSVHGQRYEAVLNLQLRNADFTEVSLSASASFLKLSRTRVILSTDNEESIKIMLDDRSDEILKMCNDILQLDPASVTVASAGFVTLKSATEGEFTIDVSITRSACFLIRQLHQQRVQQTTQLEKKSPRPTPTSVAVRSSPPSASGTQSKRPPMPHTATPVLQTPRHFSNVPASAQQTHSTQSTASSAQRVPTPASASSRSSRASTGSKLSCASDDSVVATAETLLMLRTGPGSFTPQSAPGIASAKRSASAPRSSQSGSGSGSAGKKGSPPVVSIYSASASCDIRNFVRAHSDLPQGYAPVTTATSSSESFVEAFAPQYRAVTEESIQQHNHYHQMVQHKHHHVHQHTQHTEVAHVTQTAHSAHSLVEKKVGVYFRKDSINFGAVTIGSLTRANIELCNATDEQVTVYLGDPMLPYVLLHNEISLRPRAYVRVPLRFLPVEEGDFCNELIAQTADGTYHTRIHLAGSAYA